MDAAVRVSELLSPWLDRVLRVDRGVIWRNERVASKRKRRIMENMTGPPLSIGRLYRSLTVRHVYAESYKTFQRDIFELVGVGDLVGMKSGGGVSGNVTFISLPGSQATDCSPTRKRGRHMKGCTCPKHAGVAA